jgi:surface antigen
MALTFRNAIRTGNCMIPYVPDGPDTPVKVQDRRSTNMCRLNYFCLAGLSALLITGCAGYQSPQEQSGMVIGGVLGGVLGSQIGHGDGRTAAIILGSLAGAAVGGSVGHSMAETDRIKTTQALETVRTGVPSSWRNPDSGNQYVVLPTRTYDTPQGPCRDYSIDAVVAGRKDKVFGSACRQSDGSWQVRN